MSDIVERLRQSANACEFTTRSKLLAEAADKIERDEEHYRAAMAMSEKHRKLWVEKCQEVERLREALQRIADYDGRHDSSVRELASRALEARKE